MSVVVVVDGAAESKEQQVGDFCSKQPLDLIVANANTIGITNFTTFFKKNEAVSNQGNQLIPNGIE